MESKDSFRASVNNEEEAIVALKRGAHMSAQPLLNSQKMNLMVEEDDAENFDNSQIRKRRTGSEGDTMVEIKPILTTGWFDTKEEYEAHRRQVKSKLHVSARADGKYEETRRRKAYESYRDMGGIKGSLIMGGPDAFDVTSKGGIEDIMGSID